MTSQNGLSFLLGIITIYKKANPDNEVKGVNMLTAKIYLHESGELADLKKDFPIYQGQFQNILLNVFVPTSLLASDFQTRAVEYEGIVSPFVAGTAVKIAMRSVARNGAYKVSNDHYLRYIKTLVKDGKEYALFERKMPREFTEYAGQGTNSSSLIINAVNAKYGEISEMTATPSNTALTVTTDIVTAKKLLVPVTQTYVFTYNAEGKSWYLYGTEVSLANYGVTVSGTASDQDTITLSVTASEPTVTNILTSQTVKLDVMPSSGLDSDTAIEADEWDIVESSITSLTASINGLLTAVPQKQDIADSKLATSDKTVVGAINEVKAVLDDTDIYVDDLLQRVSKIETNLSTGETYIGTMRVTALPTDTECNDFVEEKLSREPKNSDVIIVVLTAKYETDKNYKYFYTAEKTWASYEIPLIENASNGNAGIVAGTYSFVAEKNKLIVDIADGKINSLWYIDNDGVYVNVIDRLKNNYENVQGLIQGTLTAKQAKRAETDYDGNNIVNTYMTKASGATKQYVKEYALPKEFNNVQYLTANGYSTKMPTKPSSGIQYTATSSAIGNKTLFQCAYTLGDLQFSLASKNNYSNNFFISTDIALSAKFRLVTAIKKGTNEAVNVAVELTNNIDFVANVPQKITLGSTFALMNDTIYNLENGDLIIQTLEIVRDESATATINVYCNSTYPSVFYLFTGVVAISTSTVVQEEGTSETNVMSQKAVTDSLGLLNDKLSSKIDGTAEQLVTLKTDQTVDGIKTFSNYIKTPQVANTNGKALVRYKDTEQKSVYGNDSTAVVLMGNTEKPYYSNSGSDFEGKELELAGVETAYNITAEEWDDAEGIEPFTCKTAIDLDTAMSDTAEVGVVNNNPLLYATYGIVVGEASGKSIILWAVEKPTDTVTVTIKIRG